MCNETDGAGSGEGTVSIYEHIQAHVIPGEDGLSKEGTALPDDARIAAQMEFRCVPGAMDGVIGHHFEIPGGESDSAASLMALLKHYCETGSAEARQAIYEWVVEQNVMGFIDPFQEELRKETDIDPERVYELGYWLATESPDREPVKLGIGLLGMFEGEEHKDIFHTLGLHEEFTLFCVVAIGNSCDDPESELWALAKKVKGWGRIHTVERLAETENPEIQDWLLREGFLNSVMYEYIAYTCAVAGNLRKALEQDQIDEELLISAGEIIDALLDDGPAEDMDDYEDGAEVVERYLAHLAPVASMTKQFLVVHAIEQWLSQEHDCWEDREERGWSADRRERLTAICRDILARPQWRDLVLTELQSDDALVFSLADAAAEVLEIDTWGLHWQRLQEDPLDSSHWYSVMKSCTAEQIGDVIQFAERSLPLDSIATGPSDELGLGKKFEAHMCLSLIQQDLGRFPGYGVPLLQAALKSPVVRNRSVVTRVLGEWGKENWPDGIEQSLRDALAVEPEEKVREWMQECLDGKAMG